MGLVCHKPSRASRELRAKKIIGLLPKTRFPAMSLCGRGANFKIAPFATGELPGEPLAPSFTLARPSQPHRLSAPHTQRTVTPPFPPGQGRRGAKSRSGLGAAAPNKNQRKGPRACAHWQRPNPLLRAARCSSPAARYSSPGGTVQQLRRCGTV
jgi:hypothetical protein